MITEDDGFKFTTTQGPAPSFAWVRRSDMDTLTADAWEMPDGTLYAAEKGKIPLLIRRKPI